MVSGPIRLFLRVLPKAPKDFLLAHDNYPLFFHEKFEATRKYGNISNAYTTRYDIYFRKPTPGWSERLKGPEEIIAWLKEKFPEKKKES